jgi:hypothetical protein
VIVGRTREFAKAFGEVRLRASAFGQVLVFEHGAGKSSGGACGIYHAHMHFVPLPKPVTADDLGLPVETYYPDLVSALESVRERAEYIVGQDSQGKTWVLEGAPFGSQVFAEAHHRDVEPGCTDGLAVGTEDRTADAHRCGDNCRAFRSSSDNGWNRCRYSPIMRYVGV